MARFLLAPAAQRDIENILGWSQEHFGQAGRRRYEALLGGGILDLAENPARTGFRSRPELADGARTYHLAHSRLRVTKPVGVVRRPRHFLLYRVSRNGLVEVARVLHDSMDLERHLPEDFRSPSGD